MNELRLSKWLKLAQIVALLALAVALVLVAGSVVLRTVADRASVKVAAKAAVVQPVQVAPQFAPPADAQKAGFVPATFGRHEAIGILRPTEKPGKADGDQ